MVERCTETFRLNVRDQFGASVIADVLDPIRNQIGLLRSLHEEFQHQSLEIAQVLQEARLFTLAEGFNDGNDSNIS